MAGKASDARRIRLLLHDIRSLWNCGSMFRTADAFAVEKIYLSGYTALPPRREISKTALGAESWIPWEHNSSPLEAIRQSREEGFRIVALELTQDARALRSYHVPERCLLIVGNEVLGVPQELLQAADDTVCIPMLGKKESLNVSVSAGIALEHLRNG